MTRYNGRNYLFSSEAVTPGHPDRLTDNIVEHILADLTRQDPNTRAGIEGLFAKGSLVIGGEVTTTGYTNIDNIARQVITETGYTRGKYGLDAENVGILNALSEQSPEINAGVFTSYETRNGTAEDRYAQQGAGDQGLLFGYAVNDNNDYHPAAHKLANLLAEKLYTNRKHGNSDGILLPDGKTQVTLRYEDGVPVEIHTILISTQHVKGLTLPELREHVINNIIRPVINDYNSNHNLGPELKDAEHYIINPAGEWNIGGPASDAGVVGRKIIADSYGSYSRHGGGNMNGKDLSKVDRSANYYSRYVAKNLVAAGVADEIELQVAYGIGVARPLSIHVDTKGTANVDREHIDGIVNELFDFRPLAIIEQLNVPAEAYEHTALFGHYGRNPEGLFTWERLDKVDAIKALL